MKHDYKIHVKNPNCTVLLVVLIALTVFITYGDMLNYFFTSTDSMILIKRGEIQSFNDLLRILSEPLGENLPFYRPIQTLSFSLDYSIWKLNPVGYHLTDITLHILVSVLLFFFIRLLTNGAQFTALLGSLLFTTHPIIVEVVPAIARRQEIILALFILLSLIFFLQHLSATSYKKTRSFLSIVSYILALGAKEIAIVLPIMIFAYLIIFSHASSNESSIKRGIISLKKTLPYIIVSIIYILWRAFILGGIGGYSDMPTQPPIEIIKYYLLYLFYPVDFMNLSALPDFSKYVFLLAFIVTCLSGFYQRYKIREFIITSEFGGRLLFLTLWLLLPLSIYMITFTFSPRYMFFSVIPFCIILSTLIVKAFHGVVRKIKDSGFSELLIKPVTLIFVLLSGLVISLVSYSPLIRNYGEWEAQANISNMIFDKLSTVIYKLPNNAEIHIYDCPIFFVIADHKLPHVQTAVNLNEYSIKSWLDLMLPNNHFRIIRHGEVITADPREVGIEIKMEGVNRADVVFTYTEVCCQ